jgi:hypothetical protein
VEVLLAAPGPEALARGEFDVVLGEIHKMVYYEAHPVSWPFCPAPADVIARLAEVLPDALPRILDAPAQHHSRGYGLPADVVIDVVGPSNAARLPGRAHPISEFVVEEQDGELSFRHLRSALRAPLMSVMQNLLYRWADRIPPVPAPDGSYGPRLRLGAVVLRRRTWRLEAPALAGLVAARSPAEALLAGARLASAHRLPRRLFAKSPLEPKPIFVDLESPLSLELLIKLARKTDALRLSELCPDGDHLWLEVEGARRTSELRLTYILPS